MAEDSLHETEQPHNEQWLNLEQMKIAKWLKKLRFRRKLVGGISEQDVWKKIGELNIMYEAVLTAERVRYDTLIEHYKKESINATSIYDSIVDNTNTVTGIGDEPQTSTWNKEKVGNE